MIKKIRYYLEYYIILSLSYIIEKCPLSFLYFISSIIGGILYFIPSIKNLVKANISVSFPELEQDELKKIIKKNLSNTVLIWFEFIWFGNSPSKIEKYISIDDKSNKVLDEYIQGQTGLILVAPHLGNWELCNYKLQKNSALKLAVVAKKLRNPLLHKFILNLRISEGTIVIPAKGAIKGMIKALKKKLTAGTLIDQNTKVRDGGIFVNFFKLPVPSSTAPAWFAKKLKIPSIFVTCVREGNKQYTVYIEKMSKPPTEYESDLEMIQELMNINEKYIRKYTDQYLWLYKRFQHIPQNINDELIQKYPKYSKKVLDKFYSNKPS